MITIIITIIIAMVIITVAFILLGKFQDVSESFVDRVAKPKVPKPEIRPPAQKPTKIMGQNTSQDFFV